MIEPDANTKPAAETEPAARTGMSQPAETAAPLSAEVRGGGAAGAHLRTAGTALVNWWRAVSVEALCVAVLWFIGLAILHVPLAAAWALVAGLMAFVPNIGGVIALIGPVFSILFQGKNLERLGFLMGIYAIIVVVDQLVLQPWLLKKITRVPIWASILVPLLLAFNPITPFWGVLLAPPLLAVIFAFRKPKAG